MSRCRVVAVLLAGFLFVGIPSFSTTVIPPTFAELVDHATTIFVGETVARRSSKVETREGSLIVTLVTFNVIEAIKGMPGIQMNLEFLGGTVGDETMAVGGMPQFNVGDRDVLFVGATGNTVSPLIGFAHGRFRIAKESASGVETVRTYDGRKFMSTASLGPRGLDFPRAETLSLASFKAEIVERMRGGASRQPR